MKKIFGVIGIAVFVMIPIFVTPVVCTIIEEDNFNNVDIKLNLLIAIGRINYCFDEKIISGFVLIGYNAGEILIAEKININYEGIPLVITYCLVYTFCFYTPIDNST